MSLRKPRNDTALKDFPELPLVPFFGYVDGHMQYAVEAADKALLLSIADNEVFAVWPGKQRSDVFRIPGTARVTAEDALLALNSIAAAANLGSNADASRCYDIVERYLKQQRKASHGCTQPVPLPPAAG